MIIDDNFLNQLSAQAKASQRLRMNYDLRNNENDNSQRLINALEPGTMLPIHRHPETTETMLVLRGALKVKYHDNKGKVTQTITLQAEGPNRGICVPQGMWHSSECLSTGTILFITKDGKYDPQKSEELMQTTEQPLKQDILNYLDAEMRSMESEMVSVLMLLYHLGEGVTPEAIMQAIDELVAEGKALKLKTRNGEWVKLK